MGRAVREGFQELKIKETEGNIKVVERVNLHKENIYSISAWVKLRNENGRTVRRTLRGKNVRNEDVGQFLAKKGRWLSLKANKSAAKGSLISINQIRPSFLLGCAMKYRILDSYSYIDWTCLGNASAMIYSLASKLDPNIPYNTAEYFHGVGIRINVKRKMEETVPGNMNIKGGIGAQAHFAPTKPHLAYMRSALDTLGSLGYQVCLTEVYMPKCLDHEILREAYSHPTVKGIIILLGLMCPVSASYSLLTKTSTTKKQGISLTSCLKEWQQEPAETPLEYHENNDEEEGQIIGFSPEISLHIT
ncbi:hypothetical protein EUTSA_v10023109mg [Eutrema salsugineum]|uniref:GH10 domain-containing protein n=1 Tax=Eutrema salsugineum TaxID=72664 RepID=V4NW84_EUTSA|nr:hypothetical protein EUTSA_v10023109mg [Eutrema salsugineum]